MALFFIFKRYNVKVRFPMKGHIILWFWKYSKSPNTPMGVFNDPLVIYFWCLPR